MTQECPNRDPNVGSSVNSRAEPNEDPNGIRLWDSNVYPSGIRRRVFMYQSKEVRVFEPPSGSDPSGNSRCSSVDATVYSLEVAEYLVVVQFALPDYDILLSYVVYSIEKDR